MSAADKLRDLHERMPPVNWRVWEYVDGSAYLEHTKGIGRSGFIAEIRENMSNNMDALVDVCDLRNALPEIAAAIKAAEKHVGLVHWTGGSKDCPGCDLARALAALNARLDGTA